MPPAATTNSSNKHKKKSSEEVKRKRGGEGLSKSPHSGKKSPGSAVANSPGSIMSFFNKKKRSSVEEVVIIDDEDDGDSNGGKLMSMPPTKIQKVESVISLDDDGVNNEKSSNYEILEDDKMLDEASQFSETSNVNIDDIQGNDDDRVRSYYLYHFLEILNHVMNRDGHLFIQEEISILEKFKNLCKGSQRLFIRMFNRKQKYFSEIELDKYKKEVMKEVEDSQSMSMGEEVNIHIPCCENINDTLEHLSRENFIQILSLKNSSQSKDSSSMSFDSVKELLEEFTNKQLKLIVDKKNLSNVVKKQLAQASKKESAKKELIKQILTRPESIIDLNNSSGKLQSKLSSFIKKPSKSGVEKMTQDPNSTLLNVHDILKLIYKASTHSKEIAPVYYSILELISKLFKRIHHLYFISQASDNASIMILEQKKLMTFPKYEIQGHKSLFETREDLLNYEESFDIANTWVESMEILTDSNNSVANTANIKGEIQNTQDTMIMDLEAKLEIINKTTDTSAIQKFKDFTIDISKRLQHDTELVKEKYSGKDLNLDYYLMRFRCGYIYARILMYCIKLLEKHKEYSTAIDHIHTILKSPFLVGKRGELYNRMALDYEHQKTQDCFEKALEVCKDALSEKTLTCEFFATIRIPPNRQYVLEKRYVRLCKKLQKKKSTIETADDLTSTFISTNINPPKLTYIQGKTKKLDNRKKGEKKNHFVSHTDQETGKFNNDSFSFLICG